MLRSVRYCCVLAGFAFATVPSLFSQNLGINAFSSTTASNTTGSASSDLSVSTVFLGSYAPDGNFKRQSQFVQQLRLQNNPSLAPPSLPLSSLERVIVDYEPPAHAARRIKGHSAFANFRDALITFAYGRERLLQSPIHLVTDSRGRLIVSDPNRASVHVLNGSPRTSFRIEGAPDRRLVSPAAIAVDNLDNIYIADAKRGFILVYDPQGHFLRYIGNYHGETIFEAPVGLAIDREAKRLYVIDNAANQLVMLDLQGTILKRIGGDRDRANRTRLNLPSEIAVRNSRVVVLDQDGTRIQIFDNECNYVGDFDVQPITGPPHFREMGLAIDSSSNIYVSNLLGSAVRIYHPNGRLVATVGHFGTDDAGFNTPSGVWIDSADRIYVADTNNNRVQVFQLVSNSELSQVGQIQGNPR